MPALKTMISNDRMIATATQSKKWTFIASEMNFLVKNKKTHCN